MKYCKKCIMPDTRPRLVFNNDGVCAACEWHEIKKTEIDWEARQNELKELCDQIRGKQRWDCIVPASGGKDSIYVVHKMKQKFNLNVLTVTITPPLETNLIQENMAHLLSYGYDNIKVTPNPVITQQICKKGFIEQGRPLLSWTSCLNSVMFQLATHFKIPLVMFGEEGETEYGGTTEFRYKPYYTVDDAIRIYTYGNDPTKYAELTDKRDLALWTYPTEREMRDVDFKVAHWSYYENWDAYDHFVFARDNYGMKISESRNSGTYTSFGQLDTPLYVLHTYMMYLKFGFGRCLQDACIDIRGGRLSREEAVEMVRKYDGEFIEDYIADYLDYYKMTRNEFDGVLDRHANKELFEKVNGIWCPKFVVE